MGKDDSEICSTILHAYYPHRSVVCEYRQQQRIMAHPCRASRMAHQNILHTNVNNLELTPLSILFVMPCNTNVDGQRTVQQGVSMHSTSASCDSQHMWQQRRDSSVSS